jgi:CubicO group peptidase (beta-lactamase class C family)
MAAGPARRAWHARNRLDTRFNLASMTKMFTAIAVAQLVEQGKLAFDDPVGRVLPDYPNKAVAERVTVRHLLTHTSGLAGADRTAERLLSTLRQGARTVKEHLAAFVNDPLQAEPGLRFEYSNDGYILLGAIIEKVSGQDYYDYIREHVFRPAGMSDSDFYELDSDPPNLATGLMDAPHEARRSNALFVGVKGMPAGGAYSTVGDLLKFERALLTHKLLSAKTTTLLWTGSAQNARYGSGFELSRYNKARIIGHGGGWFGVTNRMEFYPDLGYAVVVLSNYDSDPVAIANKLREWLTQSPSNAVPTPPAFTLTVAVSPETAVPGEPLKIVVTLKNAGGEAEEKLIDMEVKDASGAKAEQQFTPGQSFDAGETKAYTYTWTPTKPGVYAVDVGIFGDNWSTKHIFINSAATITVR